MNGIRDDTNTSEEQYSLFHLNQDSKDLFGYSNLIVPKQKQNCEERKRKLNQKKVKINTKNKNILT